MMTASALLSALAMAASQVHGDAPPASASPPRPPAQEQAQLRNASAAGVAAPDQMLRALEGSWRVAALSTGDGVNALLPNDPTYMGRRMTIAADHIWWEGVDYHDLSSPFRDICLGPKMAARRTAGAPDQDSDEVAKLARLRLSPRGAYTISCTSGSWGPSSSDGWPIYVVSTDVIAMPWYDGGMLKLTRSGSGGR